MKTFNIYITIIITALTLLGCQKESKKIQNIETFAKLYGYARWFHPSDEAQEIDWDKFAILGIQKVENIKSDSELRDTLYHLFSPFVQGLQISTRKHKETFYINSLVPPDTSYNKIVAWQHSGVYLGEKSNIYKSIRTNRNSGDSFSFFSKPILDASKLRGKEVRWTGYFKIESKDSSGNAFLYLSPLEKKEMLKYYTTVLTKKRVEITSVEWEKYEINSYIDNNTDYICYGGALKNDVSLFADNFEFRVKEGESWLPIDSFNLDFELGKIEDNINNWYFDENGHKIELTREESYAGTFALKADYKEKLFEEVPEFGEFINEPIGNNLYCIVPMALYDISGKTFPIIDNKYLRDLKTELSKINITSDFNPYSNLASILISWNVFQHFYPYFDVVKKDWEKVLPETIKRTIIDKNNDDFTKTLCEMVAKLEDGHGVVYGTNMYHLPIRTEWIDNKIVITASNDNQLKVGDIIKKVDGVKSKNVLKDLENKISGSAQLKNHRALNIFGSNYESKVTHIIVKRNGKKVICDIQNMSGIKNMFFNPINEIKCKSYNIKEIEPGIFYVNISNCTFGDIKNNIQKLAKAKCVIYDYRWGGKFSLMELIPHLTKTVINTDWWGVPQIIYPNREKMNFQKSNSFLTPIEPYFTSKSIFITAPCVVSGGETEIGIINYYKLGTTIGEQTAGCNGNVNWISLPNGFQIMWTGMKVFKHDGTQLHLIGYKPDYPVKRTMQGIKDGKDELLEKAIEVAKN